MAQQNKSNSLTEGSVARGMLLFAIPIFISNLFQQQLQLNHFVY